MRAGSIYIILYTVGWVILLYFLLKKVKNTKTSILIVGSYIVYGVVSVLLYNDAFYMGVFNEMRIFPFIYLFFMLYLSIRPAIQYDKAGEILIERPNDLVFGAFSILYVLLSLLLLPQYLSHIQEGLITLLMDTSGGMELYEDSHSGAVVHHSLMDIPSFVFTMFSYVAILVFFYYLTQPSPNKFILFGLLASMLVNLLSPISNGLRTSTIMMLFAIVAAYFILAPYLPKKTKRIVKMIGMVILGLVVFLVAVLTISRFDTKSSTAGGSTMSYIGQANLNFNNYGLDAGGIRYGDRTFRVFKEILGFPNVPSGPTERRFKYSNLRIDDNRFSTFVGDFTIDFGSVVAVVIFIVFSLLFLRLTKPKNGMMTFSQLIILYLSILIPLQGGMYLFNYSDGGNYRLIGFAFCALLFNYKGK